MWMWILFRDVCADLWLRTSGREALEGNVCARRVRETDVGWSGRMGSSACAVQARPL